MADSPIFAKVHDLLVWLVPRTLKFPREQRFVLARRIQERAFDLQRALVQAAKAANSAMRSEYLRQADAELSELRLCLRLAHELSLLDVRGYEHVARLLDEIGRLLGGWQRKGQ
jgi:four helix bundle protein